MADHNIGKIFVELDLDPGRFVKSQQKILKNATKVTLDIESNFKTLGAKSDAVFNLMKAQAINAFEGIKRSGKATANDLIRAEKAKAAKIQQINDQQYGKQIATMQKFKSNYLAISASIAASIYVIQKAARPFIVMFEKGFNAVEDYAQSVAGLSAMVVTFTERAKGVSLPEQWQEALKYSTAMVPILENLAAKTLLSGQETTALANAFARAGVFLNASNEKQIESFTRISNALPLMTKGQEIMKQINSEVRAVMTGANEATSMMLQTLKAIDPSIEKNIKLWREEGTVLENIGDLLVGFGPATELLEKQWQAVKSTIETTATQILRGLMKPAYESIIEATIKLNEWLLKNKTTIIDWGTSFRIVLIDLEAEILRLAMLLDKIGGTMTTAQMFLYGPGSALGVESSVKRFEAAAKANMEYAARYEESDKRLMELAKQQIALEQELADKTTTAAQDKADASTQFTAKIVKNLNDEKNAMKETAAEAKHLADALKALTDKYAALNAQMAASDLAAKTEEFRRLKLELFGDHDVAIAVHTEGVEEATALMEDLDTALSDMEESSGAMFESSIFGDDASQGIQNMMVSLEDLLEVYDEIFDREKEIAEFRSEAALLPFEEQADAFKKIKKLEEKYADQAIEGQLAGYRQLFGALKGMTEENSAASEAMHFAQMAFAVAEIVMTKSQALAKAVAAVANAGMQGDGYTAVARMAAVAAALAPFLALIGMGFGGGGGGSSSDPSPDSGAPSTVLGAANDTGSESIQNSFDILIDQNDDQLYALHDIFQATKDLVQSIEEFVIGVLQGGFGGAGFSGREYKIPGFSIEDIINGSVEGVSRGERPQPGDYQKNPWEEGYIEGGLRQWFIDLQAWAQAGWDALGDDTLDSFTDMFRDIGTTFIELAIGLGTDVQDVLDYTFGDLHLDLTGMDPDEIEEAIKNYFSNMTDAMAWDLWGEEFGKYQQVGEGMFETVNRLVYEKEAILQALSMTGHAFAGTAKEAVHFAQALLKLAGELEDFLDDVGTYFEEFLTDAEQAAWLAQNLAMSYKELGIEMPATRDAFKDLMEGLDLTKESDMKLYVALLALAGATDAYYDAVEDATELLLDFARSFAETDMEKTIRGLIDDFNDLWEAFAIANGLKGGTAREIEKEIEENIKAKKEELARLKKELADMQDPITGMLAGFYSDDPAEQAAAAAAAMEYFNDLLAEFALRTGDITKILPDVLSGFRKVSKELETQSETLDSMGYSAASEAAANFKEAIDDFLSSINSATTGLDLAEGFTAIMDSLNDYRDAIDDALKDAKAAGNTADVEFLNDLKDYLDSVEDMIAAFQERLGELESATIEDVGKKLALKLKGWDTGLQDAADVIREAGGLDALANAFAALSIKIKAFADGMASMSSEDILSNFESIIEDVESLILATQDAATVLRASGDDQVAEMLEGYVDYLKELKALLEAFQKQLDDVALSVDARKAIEEAMAGMAAGDYSAAIAWLEKELERISSGGTAKEIQAAADALDHMREMAAAFIALEEQMLDAMKIAMGLMTNAEYDEKRRKEIAERYGDSLGMSYEEMLKRFAEMTLEELKAMAKAMGLTWEDIARDMAYVAAQERELLDIRKAIADLNEKVGIDMGTIGLADQRDAIWERWNVLWDSINPVVENALRETNSLATDGLLDTGALMGDVLQSIGVLMKDTIGYLSSSTGYSLGAVGGGTGQLTQVDALVTNALDSTGYLGDALDSTGYLGDALYEIKSATEDDDQLGSPMTEEILMELVGILGEWWTAAKAVVDEAFMEDVATQREGYASEQELLNEQLAVAKAFASLVDQVQSVIKTIKYSDLNINVPQVKAAEALNDYDTLKLAAETSGTAEDYQKFVSFAQTYLQQQQAAYKSSETYQTAYATVMQDLADVEALATTNSAAEDAIIAELEAIEEAVEALGDLLPDYSGIKAEYDIAIGMVEAALDVLEAERNGDSDNDDDYLSKLDDYLSKIGDFVSSVHEFTFEVGDYAKLTTDAITDFVSSTGEFAFEVGDYAKLTTDAITNFVSSTGEFAFEVSEYASLVSGFSGVVLRYAGDLDGYTSILSTSTGSMEGSLFTIATNTGNLSKLSTIDSDTGYLYKLSSIDSDTGNLSKLSSIDTNTGNLAGINSNTGYLSKLSSIATNTAYLSKIDSDTGNLAGINSNTGYLSKLTSIDGDTGYLSKLSSIDADTGNLSGIKSNTGYLSNLTQMHYWTTSLAALVAIVGNTSITAAQSLQETGNNMNMAVTFTDFLFAIGSDMATAWGSAMAASGWLNPQYSPPGEVPVIQPVTLTDSWIKSALAQIAGNTYGTYRNLVLLNERQGATIYGLSSQELFQGGYKSDYTTGYAEGGISTGSEAGHMELLHGTEAVIPLKDGAIPVSFSNGGSTQDGADRPINIIVEVGGEEFDARIANVAEGVRYKAERRNLGAKRMYQ